MGRLSGTKGKAGRRFFIATAIGSTAAGSITISVSFRVKRLTGLLKLVTMLSPRLCFLIDYFLLFA
jgi:hypothetical protein